MLSKQRPGSVETTEGCRSPDGSTREKNLNTYGLRMEYLWSTYGIPMEQHHHNTITTPSQHHHNTITTPSQHHAPTVAKPVRFGVPKPPERRWGRRGFGGSDSD